MNSLTDNLITSEELLKISHKGRYELIEGHCRIVDNDDYLTGGEVIPGFKCKVMELFEF